ncbi:hypothetical protein QBC36DRAFT_355915 [Triangularia setosa]|uniref:Uncharacterized protein n=1 Tax=Triangularia setosa TaxID=2587417 RepID=A0AAN7A6D4_9PEZI|nr:hypothetical protein QBC36DRAFT_355915 [Podospora setosa]
MVFATLPRQLLALLVLAISVRVSVSADCFYFNETATELTQCSNDEHPKIESTLCCAPGDICMRNSLCLHREDKRDDLYYRGGCTIKGWVGENINDCPLHVCEPGKMALLIPCNSSDSNTPFYCREDYPRGIHRLEKCDDAVEFNGGGLLDFIGTASPPPPPSTSAEELTSPPEPTETEGKGDPVATSEDITRSSPATDSPTATEPTETSGTLVSTATDSPAATETAETPGISVSTAPGESTGAPSPLPSGEPEQNNRAVPIGVGTGVGIAVAIAGGFLVFFYIRKRQREAPIRAETPPPLDPNIPKLDDNYYPFVPYPSTAQQGSMSSRNGDHFRQPKIPNVTESVAAPREDNVYPGQPRYQPPKRTFSHELV